MVLERSNDAHRFGDVSNATPRDESHDFPEDWHGPGIDDGVHAAIDGDQEGGPRDGWITLWNHYTNTKRHVTDEERQYHDG